MPGGVVLPQTGLLTQTLPPATGSTSSIAQLVAVAHRVWALQNDAYFGLLSIFGDRATLARTIAPEDYLFVKISRLANRSSSARPNICRFSIFNRLFWPSTGPLLTSNVTPALTAS